MKNISLIVLKNDNKILLYLRDNKQSISYSNYWSLIGGAIEKGETPLQAIKREIKEEINCVVKNIEFVEKLKVVNNPQCEDHIMFIFRGEINENVDDINLAEGQKINYFKLSELKRLHIPGFLRDFIFQNKTKFIKNKK